MNEINRNNIALSEVQKNNFDKAYELLKENCREAKSYQAYNNLGVFYTEFGDTLKEEINVIKCAEDSLIQSNKIHENYFALSELGNLYLNSGRISQAIEKYKKALLLKETYAVLHNLGTAEYFRGEYRQAAHYFKRAIEIEKRTQIETMEAYVCALVNSGEKKQAIQVLNTLCRISLYEWNPNTIHMAFLCSQYDFISLTYKKIMDDFLLDFNTYLIIGYVLLEKEGKIVYNNFYKQIINEINDNLTLNDTERAALIKMLGSDCKKILGAINKEFTPQLLFEYHYFGCNIHENGY